MHNAFVPICYIIVRESYLVGEYGGGGWLLRVCTGKPGIMTVSSDWAKQLPASSAGLQLKDGRVC